MGAHSIRRRDLHLPRCPRPRVCSTSPRCGLLGEYMVPGQSNFASKIGIWACFSSQGVGELRIFDDNMDTRLYTDTMQQFMKPCALRFWPSGACSTSRTTPPITSLIALLSGSTTMEWIWSSFRPTRLTSTPSRTCGRPENPHRITPRSRHSRVEGNCHFGMDEHDSFVVF